MTASAIDSLSSTPNQAEKKSPLSTELRRRLIQKAGSVARSSKTLNLVDNSVRVWMMRNKFPPTELKLMLRYVELPDNLEALSVSFAFELTSPKREPLTTSLQRGQSINTLDQALEFLDERVQHFERLEPFFTDDVQLLFRSMGADDLFVYLSLTEYPLETTPTGWIQVGAQVAKAVAEGACLCYLYPTEGAARQLSDCGIVGVPRESDFERCVSDLRKNVAARIGKVDLGDAICSIPSPLSPFLVPRHKYVLFKPRDGRLRALARFPTGSREKDVWLHVPLDQRTTDALANFVLAAASGTQNAGPVLRLLNPPLS